MENVIFHGIAIIVLIYTLSMSASNFFYQQYFLGALLFATCFVLLLLYYNSRFRKRFKNSYFLFGIICYLVIALNFYFNDGLAGPSAYVLLMFHIIMMVLSSKKLASFWILYNVIVFSALLYVGVFYPEWIPNNYLDKQHQFWDHFITYSVSVVGIFAIIFTIKRFYKLQKEQNERKSLQLLQVNHMLQNSNEQKNKVIALISHDIRSPLNTIEGLLEIARAGAMSGEELSEVMKELLNITSNTTKMLDNILEWASFEMRDKALNITESDVKSAFESVLAVYLTLASHKEIAFSINYKDNPVIRTDIGRVILVIRNLLQNAIKFTPTGGSITFEVQQMGEKVAISVSDTGVGLTTDQLESLFLLDVKSTYGTEREKGTGLGLYLSAENAKKIGGEIAVRSEEGKGTTFTFMLPRQLEG